MSELVSNRMENLGGGKILVDFVQLLFDNFDSELSYLEQLRHLLLLLLWSALHHLRKPRQILLVGRDRLLKELVVVLQFGRDLRVVLVEQLDLKPLQLRDFPVDGSLFEGVFGHQQQFLLLTDQLLHVLFCQKLWGAVLQNVKPRGDILRGVYFVHAFIGQFTNI